MMTVESGGVSSTRNATLFGTTAISGNSIPAFGSSPASAFDPFAGILIEAQVPFGALLLIDSNAITAADCGMRCAASRFRISGNTIAPSNVPGAGVGIWIAGSAARVLFCEIVSNQIIGMAQGGVFLNGFLISVSVRDNELEALGSHGIFQDGFTVGLLALENNRIRTTVVQAQVRPPVVYGIRVINVVQAFLSGNVIEGLVLEPTQADSVIGIQCAFCSTLRVCGNRLVDIGPPVRTLDSAGIQALWPYSEFVATHNLVRRSRAAPATQDNSNFRALSIDGGPATPPSPLLIPAVAAD
jgi:hypothetical protein